MSSELNLLVVVYVEKVDEVLVRIISARQATRSEDTEYTRRLK